MQLILALLVLLLSAVSAFAQAKPIAYTDGTSAAGAGSLLGSLTGANMNTTADQAITINTAKYIVQRITVTNCSASLTLAIGGVYTAASKGGTAIVAATQAYTAITASTKYLGLTLQNLATDVLTAGTLYLSLTTAQGGAATCDLYVIGDALP